MMSKNRFLFLTVIIMEFFFIACNKSEPECYEPTTVILRNQFVKKEWIQIDSLINDTTLLDTTIVSYRDTAMPAPTMYSLYMSKNLQVIGDKNSSVLGIPLEGTQQTMTYVLQYDTAVAFYDTITYYYQTKLYFISNDCGYTHNYILDSISTTKNGIDSAAIIQKEVKLGNENHVFLYFF